MDESALILSREQFISQAAQKADEVYDKYREQHPGQRCVGITRAGKPCERFAIVGSNLCQHHGGRLDKSMTLEGERPPKVRKRKINITGRLNEIRNLIGEDAQNILDSTEEIEILTARFQMLLEQSADLPQMSKKVMDEYDKWVDIRQSGNKVRFAEQTSRLGAAIESCRPGVGAMGEFYLLTEQLRRYKETEIKRRIAMRQMLDAGDAAKLIEGTKSAFEAALAEIDDVELRKQCKRAFVKQYRNIFGVDAPVVKPEPTSEQMRIGANPVSGI
jgi:hypothetical protein